MERKNKCKNVGFSIILWTITAVLVCCIPCFAITIPDDGYLYLDDTLNDALDVLGTLDMDSEAFVTGGIVAHPGIPDVEHGGIVNVFGCAPGNILFVNKADESYPYEPVVTVYGSKFRIGTQLYSPGDDISINWEV